MVSEEQEVWCVWGGNFVNTRHLTEGYREVNEDDLVLDAKRLNANLPTVALYPVKYERFKVSYTKADKFDYHWFCTGVICE